MRKSDRTRAGILEAARAMFAEHGYEGTTVRAIAERASIDPSMIIRYFGGKDGLFSLASKVELGLPDIDPTAPVPVGAMLVGHFLELWEGSGKDMGLVILLRAAATNEAAAERIRTIFREQVLPAAARLRRPGDGGNARGPGRQPVVRPRAVPLHPGHPAGRGHVPGRHRGKSCSGRGPSPLRGRPREKRPLTEAIGSVNRSFTSCKNHRTPLDEQHVHGDFMTR